MSKWGPRARGAPRRQDALREERLMVHWGRAARWGLGFGASWPAASTSSLERGAGLGSSSTVPPAPLFSPPTPPPSRGHTHLLGRGSKSRRTRPQHRLASEAAPSRGPRARICHLGKRLGWGVGGEGQVLATEFKLLIQRGTFLPSFPHERILPPRSFLSLACTSFSSGRLRIPVPGPRPTPLTPHQ